jgi:hypothetical protein
MLNDKAQMYEELDKLIQEKTDGTEPAKFIEPKKPSINLEPTVFLDNLRNLKEEFPNAAIYFHNDMDGIASAIIAKDILQEFGYNITSKEMIPITHIEREHIVKDPTILSLYLDIHPTYEAGNVLCVDHHGGDSKKLDPARWFVLPPTEEGGEYPTVTASLVAYLQHLSECEFIDYWDFIGEKHWAKDQYYRWLVLLSMVSDHLWLLSRQTESRVLNNWTDELQFIEKDVILISMGISLLLGGEDRGMDSLRVMMDEEPTGDIEDFFKEVVKEITSETNNLFIFARELDYEVRQMLLIKSQELNAAISNANEDILRANSTINNYRKAMPRELRNASSKAKLMEMLKTVADKDKLKWKQIEFYGTEIDKLETHIASTTKRLELLMEKYQAITPNNIPGICLFINKQESEQVKGILASLLYYFGWDNIVVEETEHYALWGARGYDQDYLEEELGTYNFNRELLESYTNIEEFARDLPNVYRKSLADAQQLVLGKEYKGQIGGRGNIFGGNIKGKVPQLFSTLDSGNIEGKIKELIDHSELGLAIKGLTEGDSMVSTSQALRSKFKHTNWITIQVLGGSKAGNILSGEVGVILAWIMGENREIRINVSNFMFLE